MRPHDPSIESPAHLHASNQRSKVLGSESDPQRSAVDRQKHEERTTHICADSSWKSFQVVYMTFIGFPTTLCSTHSRSICFLKHHEPNGMSCAMSPCNSWQPHGRVLSRTLARAVSAWPRRRNTGAPIGRNSNYHCQKKTRRNKPEPSTPCTRDHVAGRMRKAFGRRTGLKHTGKIMDKFWR